MNGECPSGTWLSRVTEVPPPQAPAPELRPDLESPSLRLDDRKCNVSLHLETVSMV